MSAAPSSPLCVGVSSCLLGEAVRYDGGHKRVAWLVEDLGRSVELVPVCPEVEVGLGVPREPIHLVRRDAGLRIVRVADGADLTPRFERWMDDRLDRLAALGLAGYVFKAGSPSCGLADVPIADRSGNVVTTGDGLFAGALRRRWPHLPVVDERELATREGRERFVRALETSARSTGGRS